MTVDFSGVVDPMVNVTCLYESTDGKLWIGTDDGFLCYNLSDGKFIREKDGCGMVMAIRESTAGDIWIATKAEGLYCLSMDSTYSRRYPSLKGISDMAFVGNSIWLANENGKLMSLDVQSNMVSDISERFGIGNERIISLHNDEDNHVWVVTPNKVVKTLPEKGVAHAFDATEFGLERIAVIDKNLGSPILGGIGGICAVNNDIEIVNFDVHLPKVTKIECDGFPILSVPENQLKIKSDNKNLKFYISSFNHVSPHKSKFCYKLKGFDDNWRKISGGENILSYDNLPSGRYTLELASLMEDGSWGDSSEVLSVYKEYSIWLKWWMISIYVIILFGFIYVGIMIIKRHYKNRSEELIRDSDEMLKLTHYLESPVSLPQPEFNDFDKILLENVTKIIETNMESPDFDINMLASNMNMSRSTLTRKIKAITGKNLGDLIQDIKMQHACQYLKNGELTISEISDRIGYDRRYFTSVFRRKFGMTPREYMQNNKDA